MSSKARSDFQYDVSHIRSNGSGWILLIMLIALVGMFIYIGMSGSG